jgi:predicted ATPase
MGQSLIGHFLAMVARAGVQVIVETHSDHVLNGVRLAVNRGELSPLETVIHFFNYRPRLSSDPAHVVSPKIDSKGNLSEWPTGFFDQTERDLTALAGW